MEKKDLVILNNEKVFNENGDIEYFDPPKNVLARLNVKLFKEIA